MWLCCQVVVSKNVPYKLKPFCVLQGKDFYNQSIKHKLAMKWKHIFKLVGQCTPIEIPEQVAEYFVLASFLLATEYLKSRDERVLST